MIYRFTLISDESDDFVREIQIDPESTFYDFHEIILQSVGYTDDQMTSFFICDEDWEKEKEVTLEEMDDSSETDNWVMKNTRIDELVEDEKQKLLYVFDYMTERCFFIELTEIITGKNMKGAKCTKKKGDAPKQMVDLQNLKPRTMQPSTLTKTSTATKTSIWMTSTKTVLKVSTTTATAIFTTKTDTKSNGKLDNPL